MFLGFGHQAYVHALGYAASALGLGLAMAFDFADSAAQRVVITSTEVTVTLLDWKERAVSVVISDPLFVQDSGVMLEDLSQISECRDTEMVRRMCAARGEDPAGYVSVLFYSAWSADPVFHVVGSSLRVVTLG